MLAYVSRETVYRKEATLFHVKHLKRQNNMETIITVTDLTHHYGTQTALKGINFSVNRGEVLGLLGPNGAGKTTTIRLINGIFNPSSGKVSILGMDPTVHGEQIRSRTGVLTETPALYERLTARQNLDFFGTLTDLPAEQRYARINELLSFFQLTERKEDRVESFSKGMKQRLALARAILHHPEILFLDEPTSGLDPESANQVHELILTARNNNGQTTILCTHNLYEAQRLCDRIAIMKKGQIVAFGSLEQLRQRFSPGIDLEIRLESVLPAGSVQEIVQNSAVSQVADTHTTIWKVHVESESIIPDIATDLVRHGARILALQPFEASLEKIYFYLQNNEQAGAA